MEEVLFSPASIEDSRAIWEIRFSDTARQASSTSDTVTFFDHNQWFLKQYFSGKDNYCYVAKNQGKTIAYCRLDQKDNFFVVSISVHPNFIGHGIAGRLLIYSLNQKPGALPVIAEIKPDNIASIKLFSKTGFVQIQSTDTMLTFRHD